MRKKNFFILLFRVLSDFERKIFQTSGQKTSGSFQNYLLRFQEKSLWLEVFLQFWVVLVFLQNPLAWFSNFYLRVQSKNSGRNNFFNSSFQSFFFGFWAKHFSDFRWKTFKKLSNLPSACPEEQFVAWNFFLKFWIVLGFLTEPLAWFSIFYLRVQSKNSGRNSFFILLFTVFSDFERKNFQTSGQKKLREVFKTNFYVSRGTVFGLKFFWKFWIVLDFLQKPLAWFSKFCLRVQSKNCGRISFFCFSFQNFFEFLATYFQTFGQKTSRSCQTTLCVSRRTTFGLNFSSIVLSLYGFSAETFGIVLKLLSSCPE